MYKKNRGPHLDSQPEGNEVGERAFRRFPNKHYLLSPGPAGRPAQAWAWAGPYFGLLTPITA